LGKRHKALIFFQDAQGIGPLHILYRGLHPFGIPPAKTNKSALNKDKMKVNIINNLGLFLKKNIIDLFLFLHALK